VLVVGDPFCPTPYFRPAFAPLAARHDVVFADVEDGDWRPDDESGVREFSGSPDDYASLLSDREVIVVQGAPVTAGAMDAAPALRLICCARGGPVNVDVRAATERGIPVAVTPGKNAAAVADLTLGLIVMLSRRVPEAMAHVLAGRGFGHDNFEGRHWFGHDLTGRTLGLVGFGRVGRLVAGRALAFGMRVIVADPYVPAAAIHEAGAEPVALEALVREADVVSLHARGGGDAPLLGAAELAVMRQGAIVVNTARPDLLDEDALADGLRSGRLGGAGLDLVSPSRPDGSHPLLAFPNVVILPHIAGATHETLENGARMAAAEIERLADGEPLLHVHNRAALESRGTAT
jgi:D-3-phosphoglycerate dehydrogenase